MEVKEEKVKTKFFKKVWYSITKFEQYPAMAAEGLKRAIFNNNDCNSFNFCNDWIINRNK